MAGVFSPSFWTFDDNAWRKHLSKKPFGKDSPFLYIYSGGKKTDTGKETIEMVDRLKDMKYPKNKMVFRYFEKGTHDVPCWKAVFAEFLEAFVFQKVETLQ
jgi:predicted alpha/beta superfamily hydrolase